MSIADPRLAQELAAQAPHLSALRATFLLALHHGTMLDPGQLPRITEGDIAPSVISALSCAGFRTRMLRRCGWKTAAELGSAYPALVPMANGSWVILVHTIQTADGPAAAILDPSEEAAGVQVMLRARFLAAWQGQLLLVAREPAYPEEGRLSACAGSCQR